MATGAFAGFVAAIIAIALMGISFWLWIPTLLFGMLIGAVMVGMVE